LKTEDEVINTVRGRDRYVVMSLDKHTRPREIELDLAVQEARADYAAGRVINESDGLSCVSINISYQFVIELIIQDDEILLVNIGKHEQVD